MSATTPGFPVAAPGLEVNEVEDGYVVHQPDRDRIHYLNATAAIVLELCNGQNDEAALAGLLQCAFDLPDAPADDVAACLVSLRSEGLIL
jgi:hypothetical protein